MVIRFRTPRGSAEVADKELKKKAMTQKKIVTARAFFTSAERTDSGLPRWRFKGLGSDKVLSIPSMIGRGRSLIQIKDFLIGLKGGGRTMEFIEEGFTESEVNPSAIG